jgi:hypothetical protein
MYDLSRCYLDISTLEPGEQIREKFPELNTFPEFMECTDDMIKIAILSGDIDSPFVRIKERESMIKAIFEYLNIDIKTNRSMFERIVSYKHNVYTGAWIRYLQILHETDFTDWLLAKRDYEFFIGQTNDVKFDKESDINYYKRRNEARERVKELGQEVRRIEARLFPDSKAAREAALAESRMKIRLYAEQHAEPYTYI